jgi:hypothetical protein
MFRNSVGKVVCRWWGRLIDAIHTGERLGLLATAVVAEGGWVALTEPIIVCAGEAFVAVPEQAG